MTKITDNEFRVLRAVLTNKLGTLKGKVPEEYPEGGITAEIGVLDVAYEPAELKKAAYGATFGGMVRKGLATVGGKGTKTNPYVVTLTEVGFLTARSCAPKPVSPQVQAGTAALIATGKAMAQEPAADAPASCYATDALLKELG